MGEDRAGHMVAWAAGREEWRTALQMRLHAALGAARPSYVLVIDDVVADGWTALTAFGVLMSVLPDAKACLMAGVPGYWRETLGKEWSVTFHPDIVDRMAHAWEKDKQDLFPEAWWRTLGVHCSALVSGLTAGGGDALSSRPISEDFPSAEYLARYLSQDQWLEFPCWISATLDAKFDAWAAGNIPVPVLAPEQYIRPRTYALQAGERAWALAWLQRWSTIDEFAARCRLPSAAAEKLLADLVAAGEFTRRKTAGAVQYGRTAKIAILAFDPYLGRPGLGSGKR